MINEPGEGERSGEIRPFDSSLPEHEYAQSNNEPIVMSPSGEQTYLKDSTQQIVPASNTRVRSARPASAHPTNASRAPRQPEQPSPNGNRPDSAPAHRAPDQNNAKTPGSPSFVLSLEERGQQSPPGAWQEDGGGRMAERFRGGGGESIERTLESLPESPPRMGGESKQLLEILEAEESAALT